MKNIELCRCGVDSKTNPHPCHGQLYQCKKPAKHRFYNPKLVTLSGTKLKMSVSDTWACDECWENFKIQNKLNEQQTNQQQPTNQ